MKWFIALQKMGKISASETSKGQTARKHRTKQQQSEGGGRARGRRPRLTCPRGSARSEARVFTGELHKAFTASIKGPESPFAKPPLELLSSVARAPGRAQLYGAGGGRPVPALTDRLDGLKPVLRT